MARPTLEGAWEMESFVPDVIISAERCVSARVRLQSAPQGWTAERTVDLPPSPRQLHSHVFFYSPGRQWKDPEPGSHR